MFHIEIPNAIPGFGNGLTSPPVLALVCSMGSITINVTPNDIERAVANNSARCVVAQALIRSIPAAKRVEVDMQTIRWTQDDQRLVWITPYSVQDYLIAFDAGDEIKPFTVRLDANRRVTTPLMKSNNAAKQMSAARTKLHARRGRMTDLVQQLDVETQAGNKPTKRLQAQVKAAEALVEEAAQELEEKKKTVGPSAVKQFQKGTDRPLPTRRVMGRSTTRYYGRRLMRVNQQATAAAVTGKTKAPTPATTKKKTATKAS